MRSNVSLSRVAVGALLIGLVATAGCSWFRKGSNPLYAATPEQRPLEVPPDLDRPRTDGAMAVPNGSVSASDRAPIAAPTAASPIGFTTAGSRDDAYAKVGTALAKIDGLTVASRAQLLGAYDVNYEGANFLVRVSAVEAGAYISAVDPRGLPATGEPPTKLIAALKEAIGSK